jgi:S-adenosylmethionine:diacylglycerol 3-amino-3-carboxypropyl transferase
MKVGTVVPGSVWQTGRFDAGAGASQLLFGRMHEDAMIEVAAFAQRGQLFCIASAGCTALELARSHEVVAVDVNPAQIAYASRRISGGRMSRGVAERMTGLARAFAPAVGWRRSRVRAFLGLEDPAEQAAFWRRHLDTVRFRAAMDALLSRFALGVVYASPFLRSLPARFGRVMRRRLERGFARHPNRTNPYAHGLLLGELSNEPSPAPVSAIRLIESDAAVFLEREPPGSFDGFALSNIEDGAGDDYRRRLRAAVRRAAAPGAVAVLRSISEPCDARPGNLAGEDRSMLWGSVEVLAAEAL